MKVMGNFRKEKEEEVDKNFEFFQTQILQILEKHCGQYALLRKQTIVEYFDSFSDALKYADKVYEDKMFSVQRVELPPFETLGYI
jgi:hypothetical protein